MTAAQQNSYPPALPHDPPVEVFPDVFLVRGSYRANWWLRFSRNMVILRHGDELTLINSVRLSEAGERQLDALGSVRHVLRLGYFHGCDDRYYVDRYGAEFWAPQGSRHEPGPVAGRLLEDGGALPIPGARVLLFAQSRHPEAVILLEQHGGLLVTCDCLQHYADHRFNSLLASIMMPLMGFPLRMIVGPVWLKVMTEKGESLQADFERIEQLNFDHLIAGHGSICQGGAHDKVSDAIDKAFSRVRSNS